jgi:type IV secretory pathway TrbD component
VLPRWWAAFSGLVAVVLLIGPIGWLGLIFGVPIWTLGTSLFVLLGSRVRAQAAAATA